MSIALGTGESAATWHRLSRRMLLVHPIIEVVRSSPVLIGIAFANSRDGRGVITGLVTAGIVAVLGLLRWFTTRLRISPEQVELRHGLIRRRTVATRRDRIRTVDVTSHLMHRLLGLARVVIGTGISDRKGSGRIVLDGLSAAAATTLRDDLLHRGVVAEQPMAEQPMAGAGAGAVEAPEAAEPSELHEIVRLDRRWIRFAPFTLSGVVTGLVIWGFLARIQSESDVNLLSSGPLRSVGHTLDRLPSVVVVLLVVAAVIVFVAVSSTVGYILAFWNFRLGRHDGGTVQVTRGLFTTRSTSIERRRLVGAEISEALLLRSVGGARALAVATGLRAGRGAERGGEVLLPPAPLTVAQSVASTVLDGTGAFTVALVPHGPAAFRRRLVRALALSTLLLVLALIGWAAGGSVWLVLGAVALIAASVPLARDRYASLGHAHEDGQLVTRFGSIVRRRTVLADEAVIGWNLRRSFFQRRAGLATLTATTAAGRQGYRVSDVALTEALDLADAVTPGLLREFRA